jgi:hypothetical protein
MSPAEVVPLIIASVAMPPTTIRVSRSLGEMWPALRFGTSRISSTSPT